MCQNNEETKEATHEFDVVRSKFFNFHSIRSFLIAKLKDKKQSKSRMCGNKLGHRK